jgi:catechol 2,3-dioxygenase-like lactoylglutathione lyase family enzyme
VISQVQKVTVPVRDQDRALDFYRDKLGCTVTRDVPMGPGARWLEVALPGGGPNLVLFTPPGLESRIGQFTGIVLTAPDVWKTCEELAAKGVEFAEPPARRDWGGVMALFKDADGNTFVLHD